MTTPQPTGWGGGETEVGKWLKCHNMQEYTDDLSAEGYDDLADLKQLCQDERVFESIVSKPGHRRKMARLLLGETPSAGGATPRGSMTPRGSLTPRTPYGAGGETPRGHLSPADPVLGASVPNANSFPSTPGNRGSMTRGGAPNRSGSATPRQPSERDSGKNPRESMQRVGSVASLVNSGSLDGGALTMAGPGGKDDQLLKIIVVGESGCGKTSYIRQLVEGRFSSNIRSTVGLDFSEKRFVMKDVVITVQLWDISGQERFASMTRAYYKGAHGALVCYDVSRPKSFEMVERWKQDIDAKVFLNDWDQTPIPAVLIGNKCDCDKKVDLSNVELGKYCAAHNFVGWFETSSKTNYNVREASEYLVTHIMKQLHSAEGSPPAADPQKKEVPAPLDESVKAVGAEEGKPPEPPQGVNKAPQQGGRSSPPQPRADRVIEGGDLRRRPQQKKEKKCC